VFSGRYLELVDPEKDLFYYKVVEDKMAIFKPEVVIKSRVHMDWGDAEAVGWSKRFAIMSKRQHDELLVLLLPSSERVRNSVFLLLVYRYQVICHVLIL